MHRSRARWPTRSVDHPTDTALSASTEPEDEQSPIRCTNVGRSASGTKKPAGWRARSSRNRLLLRRQQGDFHTAVQLATGGGLVVGDRLVRAGAIGGDAVGRDAVGGQVVGHAQRTVVGQSLVQLQRTGAVGVTDNLDAVLVEFLEHQNQGVQGVVEAGGDVGGAGGEGDVARHDQDQVVALTLHLHPGVDQGLTQLGFLLVHVGAVATRGQATHGGADQRALGAVLLAGGGRTDGGTRHGAEAAIHTHLARLLFAGIGIGGTTGQQCNAGSNGGQSTPVLHSNFLRNQLVRGTPAFERPRRAEVPRQRSSPAPEIKWQNNGAVTP